jgi:hypothetical protein
MKKCSGQTRLARALPASVNGVYHPSSFTVTLANLEASLNHLVSQTVPTISSKNPDKSNRPSGTVTFDPGRLVKIAIARPLRHPDSAATLDQ